MLNLSFKHGTSIIIIKCLQSNSAKFLLRFYSQCQMKRLWLWQKCMEIHKEKFSILISLRQQTH